MTLFLRLEGKEIMKSRLHLQPSQKKTIISYIPGPRMGPSTHRGPSGSTMRFSAFNIFTTTFHWGRLSFTSWRWFFFPLFPCQLISVCSSPPACALPMREDVHDCVSFLFPFWDEGFDSMFFVPSVDAAYNQLQYLMLPNCTCQKGYRSLPRYMCHVFGSLSPSFTAICLLAAELGKRSIWALL